MSLLRRRKAEPSAPAVAEPVVDHAPPAAPAPAPQQTSPQVERALITLTTKMQHCVERLDELERRIEDLADNLANSPSHSDVLEVRIHSAKLAAELARATVELRGEIGMASDEARRAARLARSSEPEEVPVAFPVDLDLTKEEQRDQPGGWSASA